MGEETAIERMRHEIYSVLDHMLTDLDRVEILTGLRSAASAARFPTTSRASGIWAARI